MYKSWLIISLLFILPSSYGASAFADIQHQDKDEPLDLRFVFDGEIELSTRDFLKDAFPKNISLSMEGRFVAAWLTAYLEGDEMTSTFKYVFTYSGLCDIEGGESMDDVALDIVLPSALAYQQKIADEFPEIYAKAVENQELDMVWAEWLYRDLAEMMEAILPTLETIGLEEYLDPKLSELMRRYFSLRYNTVSLKEKCDEIKLKAEKIRPWIEIQLGGG